MNSRVATCSKCGKVLTENASLPPHQRVPCPSCGARDRLVLAEFNASVKARPRVDYETDRSWKTKIKGWLGDNWYAKDHKWNFVAQHRDGVLKRFMKTIRDGDTGETLRHDDMTLREKSEADAKKKRQ